MQRALNSVSDWPEGICDAYVAFEREEGTLEQYDVAVTRVDAQMKRIRDRREKVRRVAGEGLRETGVSQQRVEAENL